jgi:hypothetical protein
MNVKAFTIAILCFGAPIGANAQEACIYNPESPESCNRFVGCFNDGEDTIIGTSRGWESGVLYGEKASGATCTGTWEYDTLLDKGKGTFTCSDGDSSKNLNFFRRGTKVQAVTAAAMTTQGNRMRMWSSPDLLVYFKQEFPDGPHPTYKCGDTWVPLPTTFPDVKPDSKTPSE